MKILVGIKRTLDYAIKTRVRADKRWMETEGMKNAINPFDEIALEEAIRIKEQKKDVEVVVASCGGEKTQEALRSALAMGADRAIFIDSETTGKVSAADGTLQPLTVAKVLSKITERENPHLIFLGKQAIDDDCGQTGQMLAGLLRWPQATFASSIALSFDKGQMTVQSEVDDGLQTILLKLPAVVSVDLRLNEPRLISLQNIMKAKKKSIETIHIDQLLASSKDIKPRLEILSVSDPPPRKPGRKVDSVEQLVELLKEEAKVL